MIDLAIGTAKHGKLHRFTVMNTPGIVTDARAAGDTDRRTDFPIGCSGLFFVIMFVAGVLAMLTLMVGGA